jgi:DNA-binding MarR family transcriptional regulator
MSRGGRGRSWITRTKDRVNDRILIAQLTPNGEELLQAAEKLARVIEKRLWRGVEFEAIEALNGVLAQCLENLEDDA